MANTFLLEITTPERIFLSEQADMVVLPAQDGEQGIMAGHEKMVIALISGILRVQTNGTWREAVCSEGYAMVYGDQVVVLVQSVEWPEEIDVARAEAAMHRAEARLATQQEPRDRLLTQMALQRARARLKIVSRKR